MFIDLGFSGGPVLLGLLAAAHSIPAAFLAAATMTLAGAALLAVRRSPAAPVPTDPGAGPTVPP